MKDKELRSALVKLGVIADEKSPFIGVEAKDFVDNILFPNRKLIDLEERVSLLERKMQTIGDKQDAC